MNKTTKNTLTDLSNQLRKIKPYIKTLNKLGNSDQHSVAVKMQNDLIVQYKYYLYVRQLEMFYVSYKYRLKKLRGTHVK